MNFAKVGAKAVLIPRVGPKSAHLANVKGAPIAVHLSRRRRKHVRRCHRKHLRRCHRWINFAKVGAQIKLNLGIPFARGQNVVDARIVVVLKIGQQSYCKRLRPPTMNLQKKRHTHPYIAMIGVFVIMTAVFVL